MSVTTEKVQGFQDPKSYDENCLMLTVSESATVVKRSSIWSNKEIGVWPRNNLNGPKVNYVELEPADSRTPDRDEKVETSRRNSM